jgi:hypothetical protein
MMIFNVAFMVKTERAVAVACSVLLGCFYRQFDLLGECINKQI